LADHPRKIHPVFFERTDSKVIKQAVLKLKVVLVPLIWTQMAGNGYFWAIHLLTVLIISANPWQTLPVNYAPKKNKMQI